MSDYQLPPPADWQKFERLCQDIFSAIYEGCHVKPFGRTGQDQYGLDILITHPNGRKVGVQCKLFKLFGKGALTTSLLRREINKTKHLGFDIDEYLIATTNTSDSKVQQESVVLSDLSVKNGGPSIDIFFWDKIQNQLFISKGLIRIHYSQFYTKILFEDREEIIKLLGYINTNRDIAVYDPEYTDVKIITKIEKLIDMGHIHAAISQLDDLKLDLNSSNTFSMRVNALKAKSYISIGLDNVAIDYFRLAYESCPDEIDAQVYNAWAMYIVGKKDLSKSIARIILGTNKTHRNAALLYISTIDNREEADSVLTFICSTIHRDPDVAELLSEMYRKFNLYDLSKKYANIAFDADPSNWRYQMEKGVSHIYEYTNVSNENMRLVNTSSVIGSELQESIDLLHRSWSYIKDRDIAAKYIHHCANYAIALSISGQKSKAITVINEGLFVVESYKPLIKLKSRLLMDDKDFEGALSILLIIDEESDMETKLQIATCYSNLGKHQEANVVAKIVNEKSENRIIRFDSMKIISLSDFYINGNPNKILNYIEEFPNSIKLYITYIMIHKSMGNMNPNQNIVIGAKKSLLMADDKEDPKEVAQLYAMIGDYTSAIAAISNHFDPYYYKEENSIYIHLMLSINRIVDAKNALDRVDIRQHHESYYIECKCKIYILQNMINECLDYLDNVEDMYGQTELTKKLRVKTLAHFADKKKMAEEIMKLNLDDIKDTQFMFTACYELSNNKLYDECINMSYNLLANNFKEPKVQAFYISMVDRVLCMGWDFPCHSLFTLESTAICLDEIGNYFIRTKTLSSKRSNYLYEIDDADNVSRAIGARTVGTSFRIRGSGVIDIVFTIDSIVSKYKFAYNLVRNNHYNIFDLRSSFNTKAYINEKCMIRGRSSGFTGVARKVLGDMMR